MIEIDPIRIDNRPSTTREDPSIVEACTPGWSYRIEEGVMTFAQISDMQPFVAQDKTVREQLERTIIKHFGRAIRQRPATVTA